LYSEHHVLAGLGLEACDRNRNGIVANLQRSRNVVSLRIRLYDGLNVGLYFSQGHGGIGNHSTALVENGTDNRARIDLRK
jgi:hypothetical protein